MALAHLNMHMYAEAVPYAQRTAEVIRPIASAQYLVAQGLSLLASALRYQGNLEGALQAIQEARKISEQAVYPNPTTRMLDEYGIFLRNGLILGEDADVNLGRPQMQSSLCTRPSRPPRNLLLRIATTPSAACASPTQEQHWATSCASAIHGELLPCMT